MTTTVPHAPPPPVRYSPTEAPGRVAAPPVAPARPTVLRAWWAVATRPSRATFAAWARLADRRWVLASLAMGLALSVATTLLEALLPRWVTLEVATPQDVGRFPFVGAHDLASVVNYSTRPVSYLAGVLAVAGALALFMGARRGAFASRFGRALRPWALAQPALGAAALLVQLVILAANAVISAIYGSTLLVLTPPYEPRLVVGAVILGLLGLALAFFVLGYAITVLVAAGSAGSGLRPWPVFGIALLGYIAAAAAVGALDAVIVAIARAFGAG